MFELGCTQLFATPVFVTKLEGVEAMNERLLSRVYELRRVDDGIRASNSLGWHSSRTLLQVDGFSEVRQLIDLAAASVAEAQRYGRVVGEPVAWANINGHLASTQVHVHPGATFSGCYYLQVPDASTPLTFYDPRPAHVYGAASSRAEPPKERATVMSQPAEAGLLVLFPGWLPHGVRPNLSRIDRVSISFNIELESE